MPFRAKTVPKMKKQLNLKRLQKNRPVNLRLQPSMGENSTPNLKRPNNRWGGSSPESKRLRTSNEQSNKTKKIRKYVRKLEMKEAERQSNVPEEPMSFEDELFSYSSLRDSFNPNAPSTSVVASTSPQLADTITMPPVIHVSDDDSEIEEGEIVERNVNDFVNLIEESFVALEKARKIQDFSPAKPLFYEDKNPSEEFRGTTIPIYNVAKDESDDVICLDNTASADDSVVFVSEKRASLQKPPALLSPAVNELIKLSKVDLTPNPPTTAKQMSPGRRKKIERFAQYRKKKALERKTQVIELTSSEEKLVPSTSTSTPVMIRSLKEKASQLTKKDAEIVGKKRETGSGENKNKVVEKRKRIIFIDGSNVAYSHAKSVQGSAYDKNTRDAFSVEGLEIAIKYFDSKGFQVKAIIPEFRLNRDRSSNQQLLFSLKEKGFLVCTPSKSYDDKILLESAARLEACIVSNDFFRDFRSATHEKFQEVLNKRQVRFNWVFSEFLIADDPYGRNGPKINEILYFKD